MIFIQSVKFLIAFLIGFFIAILSLLVSRSTLCDDIRAKRGRHALKNYPKLQDGVWKWFFLTDRKIHMKKWRYTFFILETIFSIIGVIIVATMISFYNTETLRLILGGVVIIIIVVKAIPNMFPWGRYRN